MKVLIVEENRWATGYELQKDLKKNPKIEVLSCEFKNATLLLETWKIDVCAIDACRGPKRQISTAPLVSKIRKIFKGKMIAISNIPCNRIPLKSAGCNFECSKGRLAELLIRLSSDQPPRDQAEGNLSAVA